MDSQCGGPESKYRVRRLKANCRERHRMHSLNRALDNLRSCVPLSTLHQRLSKIETLRLARNYITALNTMLKTGRNPSAFEYAHVLSRGMSQTTTNLVANHLQVHPRMLMPSYFTGSELSQVNQQPQQIREQCSSNNYKTQDYCYYPNASTDHTSEMVFDQSFVEIESTPCHQDSGYETTTLDNQSF